MTTEVRKLPRFDGSGDVEVALRSTDHVAWGPSQLTVAPNIPTNFQDVTLENKPVLGENAPPLKMIESDMEEVPNALRVRKVAVGIVMSSKKQKLLLLRMIK